MGVGVGDDFGFGCDLEGFEAEGSDDEGEDGGGASGALLVVLMVFGGRGRVEKGSRWR